MCYHTTMKKKKLKKNAKARQRLTPLTFAEYEAQKVLAGGKAKAVSVIDPDVTCVPHKAYYMEKRMEEMGLEPGAYILSQIQENALRGIEKIGQHIDSDNEKVSLSAATYSVDMYHGKAIQRNHNINENINIQSVID